MSLLALIAALLLEQLHPLSSRKALSGMLSGYVKFFQHRFNGGQEGHDRAAWLMAVLPLLTGVTVLYQLLFYAHPVFAWAYNVLVLYLTMGFRQFSHYFTDIHQALRNNRLDEARRLLSIWCGKPLHELNAEEVARVTIEQALIAAHRHVFGVIVWFVLFSAAGLGGAVGALLYRLGQFLHKHGRFDYEDHLHDRPDVGEPDGLDEGDLDSGVLENRMPGYPLGGFAHRMFYYLDWLPVRLTAMTFAIVGNFEDTVYCWRTQAASWPEAGAGILLSSGAGALGVRLGMPIPQGGLLMDRPELGMGDDADADFMQSTIGLVWRSVVFWMILLLLVLLSSLPG